MGPVNLNPAAANFSATAVTPIVATAPEALPAVTDVYIPPGQFAHSATPATFQVAPQLAGQIQTGQFGIAMMDSLRARGEEDLKVGRQGYELTAAAMSRAAKKPPVAWFSVDSVSPKDEKLSPFALGMMAACRDNDVDVGIYSCSEDLSAGELLSDHDDVASVVLNVRGGSPFLTEHAQIKGKSRTFTIPLCGEEVEVKLGRILCSYDEIFVVGGRKKAALSNGIPSGRLVRLGKKVNEALMSKVLTNVLSYIGREPHMKPSSLAPVKRAAFRGNVDGRGANGDAGFNAYMSAISRLSEYTASTAQGLFMDLEARRNLVVAEILSHDETFELARKFVDEIASMIGKENILQDHVVGISDNLSLLKEMLDTQKPESAEYSRTLRQMVSAIRRLGLPIDDMDVIMETIGGQAGNGRLQAVSGAVGRLRSAKKRAVEANLKLVVKIAFSYRSYGISIPELVQAGNEGLAMAVSKFDPMSGNMFSTYAANWIRQKIRECLGDEMMDKSFTVSVVRKVKSFRDGFISEHGRAPTVHEIAEGTKLSEKRVKGALEDLDMRFVPTDGSAGDDEGLDLLSVLQLGPDNLDDDAIHADLLSFVASAWESLTEKEQEVLRLRLVADMTLEEVGEKFHLSRERIRQIEAAAIKKMRVHVKDHIVEEEMQALAR